MTRSITVFTARGYASAVYVVIGPSVRLSVRLSVTGRSSTKMVKPTDNAIG